MECCVSLNGSMPVLVRAYFDGVYSSRRPARTCRMSRRALRGCTRSNSQHMSLCAQGCRHPACLHQTHSDGSGYLVEKLPCLSFFFFPSFNPCLSVILAGCCDKHPACVCIDCFIGRVCLTPSLLLVCVWLVSNNLTIHILYYLC